MHSYPKNVEIWHKERNIIIYIVTKKNLVIL